jgi:hypothetical protein
VDNKDSILHSLIELAEKLSVKVIIKNMQDEEFTIRGGMCSLKGETLILIDSRSSFEEKIKIFCRELKKFNLDNIFISPQLREILEDDHEPF